VPLGISQPTFRVGAKALLASHLAGDLLGVTALAGALAAPSAVAPVTGQAGSAGGPLLLTQGLRSLSGRDRGLTPFRSCCRSAVNGGPPCAPDTAAAIDVHREQQQ
jgi:hypothetical protein